MADSATCKAAKTEKQAKADDGAVSAGTRISKTGTEETKRGTTAKLQILPSGGLRLIPSAGGAAPGQLTNTAEPPKGQQRFFTRQTQDGQWQLLMSYDSDPGRLYLLQVPSGQPGRVVPASAGAADKAKTDKAPVKLPMTAIVVNPKDNKVISSVLNNSRSLLGGQKSLSQTSAACKVVSLLAGSLRLAKTESASRNSTSTATTSLLSGKSGNAGSVVPTLGSGSKASHLAKLSTTTGRAAGPGGWLKSGTSPRLVQMQKPITSKRANKVVKTVGAAKLLSGALRNCKKFPKLKGEPRVKIEASSDREREEDSDSADDLPVIFPFKIDSVFSLSCPEAAVPAVIGGPKAAQTKEMKVKIKEELKVKEEVKVKEEPGLQEIPHPAQPPLPLEELLDLCGSSFVVLERLGKQDIEAKGRPQVRSRCSEYCRKRTLNYLCMLNLIRCNASKKRRLETDDGHSHEEQSLLDERPADEKDVQVASNAVHGGLPDCRVGESYKSKSDVAAAVGAEQSRKSQSKTVSPGKVLIKVASAVDRLKMLRNALSDDKKPTSSTSTPAVVCVTGSASRTSTTAATPLTLSSKTRLLGGLAACAAAKNMANAVKQSGGVPDVEKRLVSETKQGKVPDPLLSLSSSASAATTLPGVAALQILSVPAAGSSSGVLRPSVTSATSTPVPSGPTTTCVLTFIIATSASTVSTQGSPLVTSSDTSKTLGYQTVLLPANILTNSFQTVTSAAVAATQLKTVSDAVVTVSQPKTALSHGATVTQTTVGASSVPALQTGSSVLSILQGGYKMQKANSSSSSTSTQSAVVVTPAAHVVMGGVSPSLFSSSSSTGTPGGATSGLPPAQLAMNPVIPALKTVFRASTTTASTVTAFQPPITLTSSIPNSSLPASLTGLQATLPKGQGLLPVSPAAILMPVGFSSSPSQPVPRASGISIPSSVAPTLVTFSKQTPSSSMVRLPLLASRPSHVKLKLPLSSTSLTSGKVSMMTSASASPLPPRSSSSSSPSVTCLSNSAKRSPVTSVGAPTATSVSGGLSSGSQETPAGSSLKVQPKSKIKIVFPVTSTAEGEFKGTSLLKTLASSVSSRASSQTTLSSSTAGKPDASRAQTGSALESEAITALCSAQPDSGRDGSKVKIVTVVVPKGSGSAGAQPVTSQLLSANLPPGLRLVKCDKTENVHAKYTLVSAGSTAVAIAKPTDDDDKRSDKNKPREALEAAEVERSRTGSSDKRADGKLRPAGKRHGTASDMEAARRAKRALLERKYPLPPGVVIKCEPVTCGYPNDEPSNKDGGSVPTAASPPALRTPGKPPSLVSSHCRTSHGSVWVTAGREGNRGEQHPCSEAETQDTVPLPDLVIGGDEDVPRGEERMDDCQLDEPPVLTPVSPLRVAGSPAADTASLVTELSTALHQKPPSRLRVRIVSATDRDRFTSMPSPASSSSSSSLSSSLASPASVPKPSSSSSSLSSSSPSPASVPKPSSSSSSSSSSVLSSSSTNDRIRQLKEQLKKQQEELEEIRRKRAMQEPFRIEDDS